jgi:hypothetical protein
LRACDNQISACRHKEASRHAAAAGVHADELMNMLMNRVTVLERHDEGSTGCKRSLQLSAVGTTARDEARHEAWRPLSKRTAGAKEPACVCGVQLLRVATQAVCDAL